MIPVEKMQLLADKLEIVRTALLGTIAELKALEKPGVHMDGWPTLIRGTDYMCDQVEKIVGMARMPAVNLDELALDDTAANVKQAEDSLKKARAKKPPA